MPSLATGTVQEFDLMELSAAQQQQAQAEVQTSMERHQALEQR